jgi:hypothetical protein
MQPRGPGAVAVDTPQATWDHPTVRRHRSHVQGGKGEEARDSAATIAFLDLMIVEFNDRRKAIDSRALILATVSVAQLGFIITQTDSLGSNIPTPYRPIIVTTLVAGAVWSTAANLALVAPLRRSRARRKTKSESLTWFYAVADLDPDEYLAQIAPLSEHQFALQRSQLAVDIAGLLKKRYISMVSAARILKLSLVSTGCAIGANLLYPTLDTAIRHLISLL